MAEVDEPTPCPVCYERGGFHDSAVHFGHQVPVGLTWKPGEQPPWKREKVEPAHIKQDAAAVLSALREPLEEDP